MTYYRFWLPRCAARCTNNSARPRTLRCCHLYDTALQGGYAASRGGVEDTRLEANAKDTIKIRGQDQGQPFRGQTLSRPRTGMLEAKDQGHKRKCSPKKKGLQKNFSGAVHKKTFSKKFFKRSTKF